MTISNVSANTKICRRICWDVNGGAQMKSAARDIANETYQGRQRRLQLNLLRSGHHWEPPTQH
jgi:hypothetical protein